MDRLPTETWQTIFGHACTDDGRTGRSLSIVCKHFRETSKFSRFQSLKLVSPSQRRAFAEILKCTPDTCVRYLFLDNEASIGSTDWIAETKAVGRILRTLRKTLEILFLAMRDLEHLALYERRADSFPELREIRVYSAYERDHVSLALATACSDPLYRVLQYRPPMSHDILVAYGTKSMVMLDIWAYPGDIPFDVVRPICDHYLVYRNGNILFMRDLWSRLELPIAAPTMDPMKLKILTHAVLRRHKPFLMYVQVPSAGNHSPRDPGSSAHPLRSDARISYHDAAFDDWLAAIARGTSWVDAVDVRHLDLSALSMLDLTG